MDCVGIDESYHLAYVGQHGFRIKEFSKGNIMRDRDKSWILCMRDDVVTRVIVIYLPPTFDGLGLTFDTFVNYFYRIRKHGISKKC